MQQGVEAGDNRVVRPWLGDMEDEPDGQEEVGKNAADGGEPSLGARPLRVQEIADDAVRVGSRRLPRSAVAKLPRPGFGYDRRTGVSQPPLGGGIEVRP